MHVIIINSPATRGITTIEAKEVLASSSSSCTVCLRTYLHSALHYTIVTPTHVSHTVAIRPTTFECEIIEADQGIFSQGGEKGGLIN